MFCKCGFKVRTIQAMCVLRNFEEWLRNHCCYGIAIDITYSECVFVRFSECKAHAPYYILFCGLSGSTIFCFVACLAVPYFVL